MTRSKSTFQIPGENGRPAMFLLELHRQCKLVSHCFNQLSRMAPEWLEKSWSQGGPTSTPDDLLSQIHALLSCAASIGWFLFPGKRKKPTVQLRCLRLRTLLEIESLPILESLAVRNSFQHLDERLDDFFRDRHSGSYQPVSISESGPRGETIALKHINPSSLEVSFLGDKLNLHSLLAEVNCIEARVVAAWSKLENEVWDLWA